MIAADLFPPEPAMGDWHHDWAAIDEPPSDVVAKPPPPPIMPDDDGETQ